MLKFAAYKFKLGLNLGCCLKAASWHKESAYGIHNDADGKCSSAYGVTKYSGVEVQYSCLLLLRRGKLLRILIFLDRSAIASNRAELPVFPDCSSDLNPVLF